MMSETPEGYMPDTDLMILAYAAYRDNRDMRDYRYDRKAGQDEWIRIRDKATEEAYRWLESVKLEEFRAGQASMTEIPLGHDE